MTSNGQKVKVGNDILTGSGKHVNLDVEEDNCNEKTRDKSHGEKDVGQEGDNNVMQPPFALQDTPIPAAKKGAQKEGQKTVPAVPQHDKAKGHSHQPAWEVEHGE
ncbi:hypothetical protein ACSBR1_008116 [Camellia fascicularis]